MSDPIPKAASITPPPGCPICGKPADPAYRPFCSKRCADVDLQRWLTGRYAMEGLDLDPPDEEEAGAAREAPDEA
jgi:endogenous inhibitor of DNA gyrase (YacG/DUF329 family)